MDRMEAFLEVKRDHLLKLISNKILTLTNKKGNIWLSIKDNKDVTFRVND